MKQLKRPKAVTGKVYLIGAGPGDPGLFTLKGKEVLSTADVVFYDRLANPLLLGFVREGAKLVDVGKAPGRQKATQEMTNAMLVKAAKQGKRVARLKGGDPFIFGRGGEEALACLEAGIPFEVVPGVTSAIAAPAYAGIPVTHRNTATTLCIVTAHEMPGKETTQVDWRSLAAICKAGGTLVFLMGVERLDQVTAMLVREGLSAKTPAAVVRRGTWPDQRSLSGTLGDLHEKVKAAGIRPPAVTVVGPVAEFREVLGWFETRPLSGKRVVVTRAREQASELSGKLRDLGAEVVELPAIAVKFREANVLKGVKVSEYDHLLFTSANGVKAVVENLRRHGRDLRDLAGPKIGAIGPGTAKACEDVGLRVDKIPDTFVAEALLALYPAKAAKGKKFLVLRASEARDVLVTGLRERGAEVKEIAVYDTVAGAPDKAVLTELREKGADAVTFTASSTARHYHKMVKDLRLGKVMTGARHLSIGPITSETLRELGLSVDREAEESTMDGLVRAVVAELGVETTGKR